MASKIKDRKFCNHFEKLLELVITSYYRITFVDVSIIE